MDKKLIALSAATAAFATSAAIADITVYGKVHMGITSTDSNSTNNVSVTNNGSRLGFKGTKDLDNGLKAIVKYEMAYTGVDSGDAFGGARNSYVGLAGGFGTFLVGRYDSPAKFAYYATGNDHLDSTPADMNNMGFVERYLNNAIVYISPKISSFKFAAAIAAVPANYPGNQKTVETAQSAFVKGHEAYVNDH